MARKPFKVAAWFIVFCGLLLPGSATSMENRPFATTNKSSLLGSPQSWVMGPATGLPSLFGWRIERVWKKDNEELPRWLTALELSAAIPGGRVSVERQLLDSRFYAGLGGRFLYFPLYGYQEKARYLSVSIPISYRTGVGTNRSAFHFSMSAEIYTNDFGTWRVLPAFQISLLSRL